MGFGGGFVGAGHVSVDSKCGRSGGYGACDLAPHSMTTVWAWAAQDL